MNKKLKYLSVIFLLLFARGCDFYSTSLWIFEENGLAQETNPLARFFGVGWNGLVIVNIIATGIIAYCYYTYVFKYKINPNLNPKPNNFKEYISLLYFGHKNQFSKLLYKFPKNKVASTSHFGYIAIWGVIFGSFYAAMHNLLQFYNNETYDVILNFIHFRALFGYCMLFGPLIYLSIRLYKREYREYLQLGDGVDQS
ncbi:MAG: hypothetical protein RLZZ546_3059 [Bacteroidota bacterium]|jgi:hypothetical protein